MAKRRGARGMMQGRVEYRHAGGLGDGTLVDLARQGCRIKGMTPPPCGMRLRLQLWLPDLAQPVTVDLAAVRWVQDDQFGVSFLEVSPDARACLEQVCHVVVEPPQPVKVISIPPFLGSEEEVVSRGGPPMRKRSNS
jgi:PilZ domain-containing protein